MLWGLLAGDGSDVAKEVEVRVLEALCSISEEEERRLLEARRAERRRRREGVAQGAGGGVGGGGVAAGAAAGGGGVYRYQEPNAQVNYYQQR
jgi:hypothetical protein